MAYLQVDTQISCACVYSFMPVFTHSKFVESCGVSCHFIFYARKLPVVLWFKTIFHLTNASGQIQCFMGTADSIQIQSFQKMKVGICLIKRQGLMENKL